MKINNNNTDIKITYLYLALPFLVIILFTGLNFQPIWDEGIFHIKGISQFRDSFPELDLKDYHSATTPLFHIIFGIFSKIVGSEFWKLRLLNLIIGYLTACIFYQISRDLKNEHPFLNTLLFVFFPYYLILSSLVMTNILGMFFGLLGLKFFLKEYSQMNLIISSLFSTLAVFTRQFWIFLPLGMLLYFVFVYKTNILKELKKIAILSIPIIAFLPLIFYWGGISPPGYEGKYHLAINFNQVIFFLLFIGVYFFPYIVVVNSPIRTKFLFIYLFFPIIFFFQKRECLGIICEVLRLREDLYLILLVILSLAGLAVIRSYILNNKYNIKLISFILAFLGVILLTPQTWERYYFIFVPLLILELFNNIERRTWLYYIWVAIMMIFSFKYFTVLIR